MSLRLSRVARRRAPNTFAAELSIGASPSPELLRAESYTLEFHAENGEWIPPTHGERLQSVRRRVRADGRTELIFRFNHLGGLYRLTTTLDEVESGFRRLHVHQTASECEPWYLAIEGLNGEDDDRLHASFFDSDALRLSLSQRLEPPEPIATAGGFTLTLTDLEGALTRLFDPRRAERERTALPSSISATADTIELADAQGWAETGVAYIESEAIRYAGRDGNRLLGCLRGVLHTHALPHDRDSAVTPRNPYWVGRQARLMKPLSDTWSNGDRLLAGGLIESLSPGPRNLATYRLVVSDPLARLDEKPCGRLGFARALNRLMIEGISRPGARAGNDTLYLLHRPSPISPSRLLRVRLPPGPYLSGSENTGHPRHIASALTRAIREAEPSLEPQITLDERRRLNLSFSPGFSLRLLHGSPEAAEQDSILPTLGFDDEDILLEPGSEYETEGSGRATAVADHEIRLGPGENSARIYLEPAPYGLNAIPRFQGGRLARLDDEIIAYEGVDSVLTDPAPESTATRDVGPEEVVIPVADPSVFPAQGGVVEAGTEIILYGSVVGHDLVDCLRGAWDTEALPIANGSPVRRRLLPCLYDARRGLYGTTKSAHDGLTQVTEILSSDRVTIRPSSVEIEPRTPADFLLDLLDGGRSGSRSGLRLSGDLLDSASFDLLGAEASLPYDGSFRRIVEPDETARDVLADVLRSLDAYLFVDAQGRLSVRRPGFRLRHEPAAITIDAGRLIEPPSIEWNESRRIQRVEASLDYSPATQEFETRVIVEDDSQNRLGNLNQRDNVHVVESRCIRSGVGQTPGSGETWFSRMAVRLLNRSNRFLTSLGALILPDDSVDLAPMRHADILHPALPTGDGTRAGEPLRTQIIEIERDLAGHQIRLGLQECGEENYGGFAPCARISDWNPALRRATIIRNDLWPAELRPSDGFRPGDRLLLKPASRLSLGEWSPSETLTIAEEGVEDSMWDWQGFAHLTFLQGPSALVPALGDWLIPASYDQHDPDVSLLTRYVFLADDSATLGSGGDPAFRLTP